MQAGDPISERETCGDMSHGEETPESRCIVADSPHGDARVADAQWAYARIVTRKEDLRGDARLKYGALVDYLRQWCRPRSDRSSRAVNPVIVRGPPGCGKASMMETMRASGDLPNVQFVDGSTLTVRDCMHRLMVGGVLPGEQRRGVLVIRHASEQTVRLVQDARSQIYAGADRTHKRKRGSKSSANASHPKMIPVLLVATSPGTIAADWRKWHHLVDLRAHHVEDLFEIAKDVVSALRAGGHSVPPIPRDRLRTCICDAEGDARRLICALQMGCAPQKTDAAAEMVTTSAAVQDDQALARRLFGSYLTASEWNETYERYFPRSMDLVLNEYTAGIKTNPRAHGPEEDHIVSGSVADDLDVLGLVDIARRRSTPLANALVAALLSPGRRGREGHDSRFPGASTLWVGNPQPRNGGVELCVWSKGGMEPPESLLRDGNRKRAI